MKRIEDILFGKTADRITKILVIAAGIYFLSHIFATLVLRWLTV